MEAQRLAEEAEAAAAERQVLADPWTQEQQVAFETALLDYPFFVEKNERWMKIADRVQGKTRNQCIMRYKFLKEYVEKRKKLQQSDETPSTL